LIIISITIVKPDFIQSHVISFQNIISCNNTNKIIAQHVMFQKTLDNFNQSIFPFL